MHLFKLDRDGNTKWIQAYCRRQDYPQSSDPIGRGITITSSGDYLINGYVWWENPWGPAGVVYVRSMFVLVEVQEMKNGSCRMD